MGAATAIGAGLGMAGGVVKYFEGRKMQREAQRMIDSFEWQELQNPYENLQVSTLGSDLQREELARMSATSVDALRGGGTRALVGGLGRVQAQNNLAGRQIAADLDQQQKQIDFATAQDQARIREMTEQRQANELAGYGQMLNVGMGMKFDGISDAISAVGAGAQGYMLSQAMGAAGGAAGGANFKSNTNQTGQSRFGQYNVPNVGGMGGFMGSNTGADPLFYGQP